VVRPYLGIDDGKGVGRDRRFGPVWRKYKIHPRLIPRRRRVMQAVNHFSVSEGITHQSAMDQTAATCDEVCDETPGRRLPTKMEFKKTAR
jgi:hypothetical protein